jgi:hypothetical protein
MVDDGHADDDAPEPPQLTADGTGWTTVGTGGREEREGRGKEGKEREGRGGNENENEGRGGNEMDGNEMGGNEKGGNDVGWMAGELVTDALGRSVAAEEPEELGSGCMAVEFASAKRLAVAFAPGNRLTVEFASWCRLAAVTEVGSGLPVELANRLAVELASW